MILIKTYLERVYSNDILSDIDPELNFFTEPGSRFKPTYFPVVEDDGRFELKEKGYEDIFSEIQSHKDSVDVNLLVKRFQNGDINALTRARGFFADISDMPENMHEALQIQANCEAAFAVLPPEVREEFDNDVNKFVAAFGTDKFFDVFKEESVSDEVVKEVIEDVKESE